MASRTTKSESFIRPSIDMPSGRRADASRRPAGPREGVPAPGGPALGSAARRGAGSPLLGDARRAPRSHRVGSRWLRGLGRSGRDIPVGHIPLVMLDPLLVPAKLMLDLVDTLIHRRLRRRAFFGGDESVLEVIDGHLDRHQPAEIFEQLLGLVVEVALLLRPQAAVAGRYLDVHPSAPCLVIPPARDDVSGTLIE